METAEKRLELIQGHLDILDNRTNKTYDIKIHNGYITGEDLSQIKDTEGKSLCQYDPGYANTLCCSSAICFTDGEKGTLEYRGYDIHKLAIDASFLDISFLLLYGDLPTPPQSKFFQKKYLFICRVLQHSMLHSSIIKVIQGFKPEAHPMAMMASAVAALGTIYPEFNPTIQNENIYKDPAVINKLIHLLIGVVPTIAAAIYRHKLGLQFIQPNERLSYVENLLYMMDKKGETDFRPNQVFVQVLEALMNLHAEHEMACSTAAIRHLASAGTDIFTAVSGAILTLYGPKHGGANEAVIKQFEKIGRKEKIIPFLEAVKKKKELLFGFGHRIYKVFDSRIDTCRVLCNQIFEVTGKEPLVEIATEIEKIALSDPYFKSRNLYPNLDFYSGIIYKALGFQPEFFTVLFVIARLSGWLAHWKEFIQNHENQIYRPRSNYIGKEFRKFIPINKRKNQVNEDLDAEPDLALKVKPANM